VNWNDLDQDKKRWRALVNTVVPNENKYSIKGGQFINQMSDYQHRNNDSVP
jgi:hypothetical protein